MPSTVRKPHLLTPDDYLAFDTNAEEKYEFVEWENMRDSDMWPEGQR